MDLDVDEPAAVGRRQRHVTDSAAGLAVFALSGRQDDSVVPVGGEADHLEPAAGVGEVQDRAVREPSGTNVVRVGAGHHAPGSSRDLDDRDLGGIEVDGFASAHDRHPGAIVRPLEGIDVDARIGQGGRTRRFRLVGGASSTRHGRIDDPDLAPAPPARQEGDPVPVRRPAGLAAATGSGHRAHEARAVGIDDPDLLIANEGKTTAVG